MIRAALTAVFSLALCAMAAAQPSPIPPPMPAEVPPPVAPPAAASPAPPPPPRAPYDTGADTDLEPQVTIIRRETETVEEFRVNGELRYVKVTPRLGPPYYLVPRGNGQSFVRSDSLDFGLRTPMWLLFSW